ncbi:hypothetical protein ABE427_02365 [Acinetobacter higginsii]|uniref:hypothetical protein n=1 Tax=Acinetobacter higginsii TaxID=70347 RepID=UPI00320A4840
MRDELLKFEFVCTCVIDNYSKRSDSENNSDIRYKLPDKRCFQPFVFQSTKDDQLVMLHKLLNLELFEKKIKISLPNEIGLSLNIAERSLLEAVRNNKLLSEAVADEKIFYKENIKVFYDYLESIQVAIVFSYKAIESFCNAIIPQDFVYIKVNHKGIEERYKLKEIERWIPTSEKLTEIVTSVLKCDSPKNEFFWPFFKKLEKLRNEIIHSKKTSSVEVVSQLFSQEIFEIIPSSMSILQYFLKQDITNEAFPFGFFNQAFKVHKIDNPEEVLKKISNGEAAL